REVGIRLDGDEILPRLLSDHGERDARATGLPAELVQRLGTVPSYYLHYFYEHDEVVDEQRQSKSRAEVVSAIESGLLHLSAYEGLALDAALHGGRGRVFRALLAHPRIGQADVAERLADRMLDVNRTFLPWA